MDQIRALRLASLTHTGELARHKQYAVLAASVASVVELPRALRALEDWDERPIKLKRV